MLSVSLLSFCVILVFMYSVVLLPSLLSARSTRHASENLNFREAVARYQGLCYENTKKLKPTPSAGARASARVVSANASPALSPGDGGLRNDSEGDRRGTAAASGDGGGATTSVASCASYSSSSTSSKVDVAAAAAAARDIVNRFVKEGAPEQVK